jgi:protein-tyrosine phosphatase
MQPWQPNLSWLTAHLAIGGSFPLEGVHHLAGALGIRAVVDLRVEACDNRAVLARHGLNFLHLPTQDHCAVSEAMLRDGLVFVNGHIDRDGRVLVHCEHGIGRSATLALCVLVSRGMEPLHALELAKSRRSLVSPSPAQYEAWVRWLRSYKTRSRLAWEIPSFDAFKAIAYRHLPTESI